MIYRVFFSVNSSLTKIKLSIAIPVHIFSLLRFQVSGVRFQVSGLWGRINYEQCYGLKKNMDIKITE